MSLSYYVSFIAFIIFGGSAGTLDSACFFYTSGTTYADLLKEYLEAAKLLMMPLLSSDLSAK